MQSIQVPQVLELNHDFWHMPQERDCPMITTGGNHDHAKTALSICGFGSLRDGDAAGHR